MAGAPGGLGTVESGVGVAKHVIVARVARAGQRDTDADRGEDFGTPHRQGHRHGVLDSLGHANRVALAVQIVEQNGELIAHHSRQHVARTQAGFDASGGSHQQLVTGTVSETLVDALEAVEIQPSHGKQRTRRTQVTGAGNQPLDPLVEHGAVGKLGQRIVEAFLFQFGLKAFLFGDVA